MSGSTNAADVAERRRLQATLLDQQRDMEDSYREHSLQSQQDALDAEATAYEETLTKMVEGMRTSLSEATLEMENFLNSVTIAVSMNADTVLTKYQDTELYLNPALTNPWVAAKEAVAGYGGDATKLMDVWAADGYFAEFSSTAGANLSSPWNMGKTAVQSFATSVGTSMSNAYTKIQTNVQNSITELNRLKAKYKEINDEASRPPSTGGVVSGAIAGAQTVVGQNVSHLQQILNQFFSGGLKVNGIYDDATKAAVKKMQKQLHLGTSGLYDEDTKMEMQKWLNARNVGSWFRLKGFGIPSAMYAKGTTGTSRDELAIVDELGPELIMHANSATGRLEYLTKGSSVIPHDATVELLKLADVGVNGLMDASKFGANINMISNAVNKPEFNISFDALVKAENITEETLPAVRKLVTQELNRFTKELNYALKGKGAR